MLYLYSQTQMHAHEIRKGVYNLYNARGDIFVHCELYEEKNGQLIKSNSIKFTITK